MIGSMKSSSKIIKYRNIVRLKYNRTISLLKWVHPLLYKMIVKYDLIYPI